MTNTVRTEVEFHTKRLADRTRACDNCYKPFEGDGHPVTFRLPQGRLVFVVCSACHQAKDDDVVSNTAAFFSEFYVTDEAAGVLEAMAGTPSDELAGEVARLQSWIKAHTAAGEPCDECGQSILREDGASTAQVAIGRPMRGLNESVMRR